MLNISFNNWLGWEAFNVSYTDTLRCILTDICMDDFHLYLSNFSMICGTFYNIVIWWGKLGQEQGKHTSKFVANLLTRCTEPCNNAHSTLFTNLINQTNTSLFCEIPLILGKRANEAIEINSASTNHSEKMYILPNIHQIVSMLYRRSSRSTKVWIEKEIDNEM